MFCKCLCNYIIWFLLLYSKGKYRENKIQNLSDKDEKVMYNKI